MSRWLVSNVPAGLLLLGLIVVIVVASVGLQALARHLFPRVESDATRYFAVMGIIFAVGVGFLVNNLWGQINNADAQIRGEGAAGIQLARDLAGFDKADQDRIRQSLLAYQRAAEAEWPLTVQGQSSSAVDASLWRVYEEYGQVETRTAFQETLLSTSFINLDKVSQARSERVFIAAADSGPSWSVWAVIILTGGLILGWVGVTGGGEARTRYPVVATMGAILAGQVFLILQVSYPFAGETGTSPEPLREVIRVLTAPSP